jgi:hypothetical protein
MTETDNLQKYVIKPLKLFIGKKVERVYYTDYGGPEELVTDGEGIDIIAQQVIIVFEDTGPIYISWTGRVAGWEQYAISAWTESYVIPDAEIENTYAVNSEYWKTIIGKRLTEFEVYGYQDYKVTSTACDTGESKDVTYDNQPHLIILYFGKSQVAIANFYAATDFQPKYPIGDDVWIIFNTHKRELFIKELELEKL